MLDVTKVNLNWIKNNKALALDIILIVCLMYVVNYAFNQHEKFETYLIQSKQEDLNTAKQNFENSQQLLRLIK